MAAIAFLVGLARGGVGDRHRVDDGYLFSCRAFRR
jgi:hypothetical protein